MAKIYVSSTYEDLRVHRKAALEIIRSLGHTALAMEDYHASDERPLDKCLADVRSCDGILCIAAMRYGFIPPGESLSISELEYEEASKAEGRIIRMVFLLSERDAHWPLSFVDQEEKGRAIRRFRERLRLSHITSPDFSTVEDFCKHVRAAVEGSFPSIRQYPHLLPFRVNRDQQNEDVKKAIQARGMRPTCFILHGDEYQCAEMYLSVLEECELRDICAADVAPFSVEWPRNVDGNAFPEALLRNFGKACFQENPDELRNIYEYRDRSDDLRHSIEEVLPAHNPVMIHTHLLSSEWSKQGGELATSFLRFWNDWKALSRRNPVLIFLSVKYELGEEAGFFRRRELRKAHERIASFLASIDGGQQDYPNLFLRILQLGPVFRGDAEAWTRRPEVKRQIGLRNVLPVIAEAYKSSEAQKLDGGLRMQTVADVLTKILENR